MEKVTYCRFCNERHIASETRDPDGNVVGLFCNREKAMITAFTSLWNGEDVLPAIERYADYAVDIEALRHIKPEKVIGLSRKIAYQFMQGNYAKQRNLSYAFVQHHTLDVIRSTKQRQFYSKASV